MIAVTGKYRLAFVLQKPVRMIMYKAGLPPYTFYFYPQPKKHIVSMHIIYQFFQTVWKAAFGWIPVAEFGRPVFFLFIIPACIQYKRFAAQCSRTVYQSFYFIYIHFIWCGKPGVVFYKQRCI